MLANGALGGVSLQLARVLAPYAATALRAVAARRSFAAAQLLPAAWHDGAGLPLPLGPAHLPDGLPAGLEALCQRSPRHGALPDALTSPADMACQRPQHQLSGKERTMVQLYLAGCLHRWDQLPGAWAGGGCS